MLRTTTGTRRAMLVLLALLVFVVFVLQKQSQGILQSLGSPIAHIVAFPAGALNAVDRSVREVWDRYLAFGQVYEENRRLRREIQYLESQNSELREAAVASQRLTALLEFKERAPVENIAAQVIARDPSNWFRGVVLNKGERDGILPEMGVMTSAGAVGRVVRTTGSSSIVLLITDPNNAVAGLIQRTREEAIVEGTVQGRARLKYIPLLSTVQVGDVVVTSGLTGGFPRGVSIGEVTQIEKVEGDLFQAAEIWPQVDFSTLEEVLVITNAPQSTVDPVPPSTPKSSTGSR
jgi:rod shape-determining protein MreC